VYNPDEKESLILNVFEGTTINSLTLNSILAKGLESAGQGKTARLFNLEMETH